jgi:hypothetical protein
MRLPALGALLLLAACAKEVEAPLERGACWHMVPAAEKGQAPKFNKLPGEYESLEFCAAGLEMVRLQGARQEITGAYQGRFVFATSRGIFVGQTLEGSRYMSLVRTRDGRLVIPGAQNMPAPQ